MNNNTNYTTMPQTELPHNQLILNTGGTYTGIIFEPCTEKVPSEYTAETITSSYSSQMRRGKIGGSGEGWTERPDFGGTTQSKSIPVGDCYSVFFYAFLYALIKTISKRKSLFLVLILSILPFRAAANVTSLSITPASGIVTGASVTINPTIASVPSGKVFVCWNWFYDAACEHEVTGISFRKDKTTGKNAVTCTAPSTAGTYYLQCALHTGYVCGDWLDSYIAVPVTVHPSDADIVLTRDAQEGAERIDITDATNKKAYGAMRFSRSALEDESLSAYARFNYFISFPFDVKVDDIYGIGNVGTHWLVYYYDGKGRAQEGFFAERTDNWVMIDDTDSVLHAGQGYLLQLNSIQMANDATWPNGADVATLFFPALSTISDITTVNETIPALSEAYRCTIDLSASLGSEGDRRTKDSYWRCIGTPGFSSPTSVSALDYLYEWNTADNSLSVVSSDGFTFLPTHAYLVQHGGEIVWTDVTKPTGIAARKTSSAYHEWRLAISQDAQEQDRTYVRLTDDVTADFDFGRDLIKELNAGKTNIYSFVGYERLAANCLPMSDSTTIVPLGVQIAAAGTYTFSIPEGTNGAQVILADQVANTRTNLGLTDYTVHLDGGTYDGRFLLEIAPVSSSTTHIEMVSSERLDSARKVLVDGVLYIVKNGKVFDARGARIE